MRRSFLFLLAAAVTCLSPVLLVLPVRPAMAQPGKDAPPPREIRLVEKKLEELPNQDFGELGKAAFTLAPDRWKHAETDNFIVHYRRKTEAQRVVREIEYNLWFVARSLGAGRDRYTKKSHVFIFQGTGEWRGFLSEVKAPRWSASFAYGDQLFLNVGGPGEEFDSHLLAHETTHAVVSRLYPEKRWPLWANEGFAEYMGGASVATRRQQYLKGMQRDFTHADLSFEQLEALEVYPSEEQQIHQLYQSGERVIRFLMTEFPKDRIAKFVDSLLAGNKLEAAVMEVYGDKVPDFKTFRTRYQRFQK